MTTNHHTAIATGAAAQAGVINSPLAELDAAITKFYGKPAFSVHKNGTNQSVASVTTTLITWSTEVIDTDGDFASNVFTPSSAGAYLLFFRCELTATVDQTRLIASIRKNGSEIARYINRGSGTLFISSLVTALVEANGSTDYFETYVNQDSGSSQNVDGNSGRTIFQGFKLYGT